MVQVLFPISRARVPVEEPCCHLFCQRRSWQAWQGWPLLFLPESPQALQTTVFLGRGLSFGFMLLPFAVCE
jgi:hypothetical protein